MNFEVTFAVVLVPADPFASVSTTRRIQITVLVMVGNSQAMWLFDFCVDLMDSPIGILQPQHTDAMASSRYPIDLAVAVDVAGQNIGGAELILGKERLAPFSIDTVFARIGPKREPVPIGERFSLRPDRDLFPAIPVDVARAHVVTAAAGITGGEDMTVPLLRT